jgi:hypothetical protein
MFVAVTAQAAKQDITIATPSPSCLANADLTYKGNPGVAVNESIAVNGASGQVQWSFASSEGQCSVSTATTVTCAGSLTLTIPNGTVDANATATLIGTPTAGDLGKSGAVTVQVNGVDGKCGTRRYPISVVNISDGGGWGDPHMTTVDGIKYDFQSAGEFTALKEDGLEVQTRQRPVASGTVPGPSDYTGLGVCVATYSAVAMRIGSSRVTLQPNLSGQPDPSGLQLRVNGQLVTLTDSGIDLPLAGGGTGGSGGTTGTGSPQTRGRTPAIEGRIIKAAGGGYEFDDAYGTQLVATPQYWDAQKTWYLNLNIYQTSASKGIWGRLASDSWLPALPDGTSLGAKPQALDQRYQDLYVKFANAWRVTDATSLFDYAPGTSTATFTVADWPRFQARTCDLQGQTPVEPATQQVAEQACNGVTNAAKKANCVFDVMVTGNTGFGETYRTMQEFRPHGSGWQPVLAGVGIPNPTPANWPWWWWIVVLIILLIIIAMLLARKKTV